MKFFAKTLVATFFLFFCTILHGKEDILSDVLKSKLYKNDTGYSKKAELLEDVLNTGLEDSEFDLFQSEVEKLLQFASKNQNDYLLNYGRFLYSHVFISREDYDTAKKLLESSLDYFSKNTNQRLLGHLNRELGLIYNAKGNREQAILLFKTSQLYFQECNNVIEYTHSKALEAKLLISKKKYKEVETTINECLKVMIKNKKHKTVFMYYNILTDLYTAQNRFDKVKTTNEKSYEYVSKYGSFSTIALSMNNLAIAKFYNGEVDSALYYFNVALNTRLKMGKKRLICESYNNIGFAYEETKNFDKALNYYAKALELATKFDLLIDKGDAYLAMSNVYELKGDYLLANKMNKQFIANQEKIQLNSISETKMTSLKILEFEKLNSEGTQKTEMRQSDSVIASLKNKIVVLTIGYLVVLVLPITYYFVRKRKSIQL